MRCVSMVLMAALATAGCGDRSGGSTAVKGDPPAAEPRANPKANAFDERSAERTLEWLVGELDRIGEGVRPGNELSAKEGEKKRQELFAGLSGRTFNWPLVLSKVTGNGTLVPQSVKLRGADHRSGKDVVRIFYTIEVAQRLDPKEALFASHGIPSGIDRDLIVKLKSGDAIAVAGKIAGCQIDSYPGPGTVSVSREVRVLIEATGASAAPR